MLCLNFPGHQRLRSYLFLDDTWYNFDKLEIYWLSGNKILIKSDERPMFLKDQMYGKE